MPERFAQILMAAAGLLMLLAGISLEPARLAAAGIMDLSLQSDIPLVRETALFEIQLARSALLIAGILLAAAGLLLPQISRAAPMRRFMALDLAPPSAYERNLATVWNGPLKLMTALFLIAAAYLAVGGRLFTFEQLQVINQEDGFIETLSAALLLAAAVLSLRTAAGLHGMPARRAMHLFLALLFIVMCGEEISWGQRYLGIETPEAIKDINVQAEINLHNMFGYLFDHLFILLFFLWGCAVPVLYRVSGFARQLCNAIGLPVPSAGLAIAMLITTLVQDQTVYLVSNGLPGLRIPELRELFSALAFLLLMAECRRGLAGAAPKAVAA
jgi:hypothetical protein